MSNTILVVDDLSLSRMILRARLQAFCYDVRMARSGAEALEIAQAELPDLVVMDCEMPGLDGPTICQEFRRDPRTAHIPIILFSADTSRARRLHALNAGADEFLPKPLDEPYLMSRLRGLLRRSALELDFRHQATPALRAGLERAITENERFPDVALVQISAGKRSDPTLLRAGLHNVALGLSEALAPAQDAQIPDMFLLAPEVISHHGLSIISELRARSLTSDVPIIACLPETLDIPSGMALDLGAEAVLRLPLDSEIARLILENAMLHKRRADSLRAALQSELHLASRDPLTGLFNRRYALSSLVESLNQARTEPASALALLMIDLDDFKSVNDRFGHSVGDQILVEVAQRMRAELRASDLLARYGGEEFLLALPGIDAQDAQAVAERLRRNIEAKPYYVVRAAGQGNVALRVTASVGLTVLADTRLSAATPAAGSVQRLIDHADQALHMAKTCGRNRVVQDYNAVA